MNRHFMQIVVCVISFVLLCIAPVQAEVAADTNWARNAGWCEHSGVRVSEYAESVERILSQSQYTLFSSFRAAGGESLRG